MRKTVLLSVLLSLCASIAVAQTRKTLDMYVVDVEGGNAVLFVTPSGESMLVDSGNGGAGAVRDAERIVAAAKDAGVTAIDHLLTTHYHGDHIGGLAELTARIPIKEFIDHGPNTQPNPAIDSFLQGGYRELTSKAKHTVAKPGDKIPIAGVDWRIVTSAMQVLKTPLQGKAMPNPYCANFTPQQGVNLTEDDQSLGSFITFGKFRTIHLGDLTLNRQLVDVPDESSRHRRPFDCGTPRKRQRRVPRPRASSARGRNQQRHTERRAAGCHEDLLHITSCRRRVADSLFAA